MTQKPSWGLFAPKRTTTVKERARTDLVLGWDRQRDDQAAWVDSESLDCVPSHLPMPTTQTHTKLYMYVHVRYGGRESKHLHLHPSSSADYVYYFYFSCISNLSFHFIVALSPSPRMVSWSLKHDILTSLPLPILPFTGDSSPMSKPTDTTSLTEALTHLTYIWLTLYI